ncbi:potassium-transporting ATPase subunit KdpC [Arthrobacter sp. I2-34]|uniref:Potassium-transporting ATPase KdpC subunit n=1 Tax=Arthrobacter hankyongi TaxID=2904801 RepID=A0ABS9LAB8_9MICC|nr:potassium-transporting ATPase subunit KdpC [Arthrobacter hankyongi]MCG2623634.1 potassium-transporting ATPase subunit KdpC [Arthrobacter hankyongi]
MRTSRGSARPYLAALRAMLVLTAVLGIAYPLVLTGLGQAAFPFQANGSRLSVGGRPVGSALIGQSFTDASGKPLPQWFQSRPSAAGDGYDAGASGGSNWGPENPKFIAAVNERKHAVARLDGVPEAAVPADAVTASGSGLDPHISPQYALLQVPRVAAARHLSEATVRALVARHTQGRDAGYLGQPAVNVLQLNIALAGMDT